MHRKFLGSNVLGIDYSTVLMQCINEGSKDMLLNAELALYAIFVAVQEFRNPCQP
jgi:hypothetical protein